MSRRRSPRRRHLKLLRKIAKERELGCCRQCLKVLWPTFQAADKHIEKTKSKPGCREPDVISSYKCPHNDGWHLGHNYKFPRPISLCIGEMR
jgi:hypothetical protein